MQMPQCFFFYPTAQFFFGNLHVCFHIVCLKREPDESGLMLHTPVLTSDNMIRSLMANVSPCFIFILFLSKHFIAYLKTTLKKKVILLFISLYNNQIVILKEQCDIYKQSKLKTQHTKTSIETHQFNRTREFMAVCSL